MVWRRSGHELERYQRQLCISSCIFKTGLKVSFALFEIAQIGLSTGTCKPDSFRNRIALFHTCSCCKLIFAHDNRNWKQSHSKKIRAKVLELRIRELRAKNLISWYDMHTHFLFICVKVRMLSRNSVIFQQLSRSIWVLRIRERRFRNENNWKTNKKGLRSFRSPRNVINLRAKTCNAKVLYSH